MILSTRLMFFSEQWIYFIQNLPNLKFHSLYSTANIRNSCSLLTWEQLSLVLILVEVTHFRRFVWTCKTIHNTSPITLTLKDVTFDMSYANMTIQKWIVHTTFEYWADRLLCCLLTLLTPEYWSDWLVVCSLAHLVNSRVCGPIRLANKEDVSLLTA